MRVAAIFSVGTSVGGAPDAIAHILSREAKLDVHILYGERGSRPQTQRPRVFSDPKEASEAIRREVKDPRVGWGECRMVHSFEFTTTYQDIRKFINEIRGKYDRVYVGITGGTNPMNCSLFQASMAYLGAEVVPVYVQAHENVWQRSFVASEIRDRVIAEEALAVARSGQIPLAARLADRLPRAEPWKFLHGSLTAFSYWDDFDYARASQTLEHQARKCAEYTAHDLLGSVAATVARIAANARRMSGFARQLLEPNNFNTRAIASGWAESVDKSGVLLVADALANAKRRFDEQRYTDSVLRSYRAAECAAQMRLLRIGIHPSRPDACPGAYERYAPPDCPGDRGLAFHHGLQFLQHSGQLDLSEIENAVRPLQQVRNSTYLEHGYVRVRQEQSESCFNWSLDICSVLLGSSIKQKWHEFEMRL